MDMRDLILLRALNGGSSTEDFPAIKEAEAKRVVAENERVQNETQRVDAEKTRVQDFESLSSDLKEAIASTDDIIYQGSEEPTDPNTKVWIDTNGPDDHIPKIDDTAPSPQDTYSSQKVEELVNGKQDKEGKWELIEDFTTETEAALKRSYLDGLKKLKIEMIGDTGAPITAAVGVQFTKTSNDLDLFVFRDKYILGIVAPENGFYQAKSYRSAEQYGYRNVEITGHGKLDTVTDSSLVKGFVTYSTVKSKTRVIIKAVRF